MSKSAYIYLVEQSKQHEITMDTVKEWILYYKEITKKTGEQLGWDYDQHAFPYEVEEKDDKHGHYLLLSGHDQKYRYLLIGVGNKTMNESDTYYIQLTLPEGSTQGDVGKGNELAKFLAKKLEGELHLFNKRVMYYYKRK